MNKLTLETQISIDGYIADENGGIIVNHYKKETEI